VTTLQTIASRVTAATARPGVQQVDPLTIIAIIQVLTQAAVMCFPEPEEAAKYLSASDLRGRPILTAIRRRRIESAIKRELVRQKVSKVRMPEIVAAVREECAQASPDVVADLYADVRAANGENRR